MNTTIDVAAFGVLDTIGHTNVYAELDLISSGLNRVSMMDEFSPTFVLRIFGRALDSWGGEKISVVDVMFVTLIARCCLAQENVKEHKLFSQGAEGDGGEGEMPQILPTRNWGVNNAVCWRPVFLTFSVCVFVLLRGVEKEAQTQSGLGKKAYVSNS